MRTSVEVVAVVCATTALAFVAGRRLGLPVNDLRLAGARTLECVGLAVVFYLANLGCALAAGFISRALGSFASLYTGGDISLAALSLLQALLFQSWRTSGSQKE